MKYTAVWKVVGVLCLIGLVMIIIGFVVGGVTGAEIAAAGTVLSIGAIAGGYGGIYVGALVGMGVGVLVIALVGNVVGEPVGVFVGVSIGLWSDKKKEAIDEELESTRGKTSRKRMVKADKPTSAPKEDGDSVPEPTPQSSKLNLEPRQAKNGSKQIRSPTSRPSVITKIEEAVEYLKREGVDTEDIEAALQEGNIERAIDLLDSKTSSGSKIYSIESKIEEAVDSLKKEEEQLDTREVEKALEQGKVKKAEELLLELEENYEEYKKTLSELKELDSDKSSLARKLAKDEIDRDTYQDAKREIEHEKAELEEKLNKLRREIIYEDYEKPF